MTEARIITPVTPADYRRLAQRRLPRFLFDYADGGANDEITVERNLRAFSALKLRQRVLRDVSKLDTATTLAGVRASMPLALAPVGLAGMFARRGEVLAQRAAQRAGVPFTLSTVGICAPAEVRAAATAPFWFQLYMMRDRSAVQRLLARAAEAGCETLLFTVDLPMAGMRDRDVRNGMVGRRTLRTRLAKAVQLGSRPRWLWDVGVHGKPHHFASIVDLVPGKVDLDSLHAWIGSQMDPSVTWADIAWVRREWRGRLYIKGVLEADDARAAADSGADGLVVSNHGGRQLDGVAASITKLPEIAAAVGSRLEVLVDGGVRSGLDVLRALALGARGVLIGRPWIWAIAGAGEAGLDDMLAHIRRELEVGMALTGVTRVEDIGPEVLDVP